MGDNGAGKSTLVKIIAGDFRPSHGTMRMEGRDLVLHKPIEARQHGIEIVHQDLALCDNLTAAANVFLGRELQNGLGPFKILDYATCIARREDFRRAEVRDARRATWFGRCPAASARPSQLRARACPTRRSS